MKTYSEKEVLDLLALMTATDVVSLDEPVITTGTVNKDLTMGSIIPSMDPGPDEILEQKEELEYLLRMFKKLKPREEQVLKLRYGLIDGEPKTLDNIGKMYNVTRERIRQIEQKGLRKLRWLMVTKKNK